MTVLVTGGAGFIGSALVRQLVAHSDQLIVNIDKLTYSGNLDSLDAVRKTENYEFYEGDICDEKVLEAVFQRYQPTQIFHLAAESHVDRSIDSAEVFIRTNVLGTMNLLDACRKHWLKSSNTTADDCRFLHLSTDEVFGDLDAEDQPFNEASLYKPSSPYSASKASSDHLVRAWNRTYGLPSLVVNCSNNYGPRQFPEKLIPHIILSALNSEPLPIYGNGQQRRDWLYVEDHVDALQMIMKKGRIGETYCVGGGHETSNISVVTEICKILNSKVDATVDYTQLIEYVADRPGHDIRYAINSEKLRSELGWQPMHSFDTGLRKTVSWYLENEMWWKRILNGDYQLARIGDGSIE